MVILERTNRYKELRRRAVRLLPGTLSGLLLTGLEAVALAGADPRYAVRMGRWHEGSSCTSGRPCDVCVAGAIMAFTLGAEPTMTLSPSDFELPEAGKFMAVDRLRSGDVQNAMLRLGLEDPSGGMDHWAAHHVAPYNVDVTVWRRQMDQLLADLVAAGL